MDLKEQLTRLQRVRDYMTAPRFEAILLRANVRDPKVRGILWDEWRNGIRHVAESKVFTGDILQFFIDSEKEIDITFKPSGRRMSSEEKTNRKVYYKTGNDVSSLEVCLDNYIGIKALCAIYETADEILAVLNKVTSINDPQKRLETPNAAYRDIYEYDFFKVHDDWKRGDSLIVATNGCFRELLYTPKYGYLTAEGEANYDSGTIKFAEDISVTDKQMNSYALTFRDYRYAGNLVTDLHLLKNPESKSE